MRIDTETFFVGLADEMNAHPEEFRVLGDCDMVAALVMRRAEGDFAVRITCGEQNATMPFSVRDLRGPRDAMGSVPGAGERATDELQQEAATSDEGEGGEESERRGG